MRPMLFSERVNAISNLVNEMTPDPGERLGLVSALCEIYRQEIKSYFVKIPASGTQAGGKNANTANQENLSVPSDDAKAPAKPDGINF